MAIWRKEEKERERFKTLINNIEYKINGFAQNEN